MLPLPPLLVVPQLQPLLSCPSFSSSFSLESPLPLPLLQNMQKEHLEHHKLFMDASPQDFFVSIPPTFCYWFLFGLFGFDNRRFWLVSSLLLLHLLKLPLL